MGGARVHHRQVAVIVGGTADEHPDVLTAQGRGRDAGVLQRLPGQFEGHPLLGVDIVGLHLRQREELGVETLDVGEISAPGAGLRDSLGQARFLHELRPPALREFGDTVATLQQCLPHLVRGVHIAGEPGREADDRDVLDIAGPGPVLAVEGGVGLRFRRAFDDDRSQRLDGRVPEGHRRRQGDPGEVLDIAGHGHRVTGGEPEFDHRDRLVDGAGRLTGGLGDPVAQPFPHLRNRHISTRRGQFCLGRDDDLVRRCAGDI